MTNRFATSIVVCMVLVAAASTLIAGAPALPGSSGWGSVVAPPAADGATLRALSPSRQVMTLGVIVPNHSTIPFLEEPPKAIKVDISTRIDTPVMTPTEPIHAESGLVVIRSEGNYIEVRERWPHSRDEAMSTTDLMHNGPIDQLVRQFRTILSVPNRPITFPPPLFSPVYVPRFLPIGKAVLVSEYR